MKQIELKELIREVLLTEFQRGKEIEFKITELGELNNKKIFLSHPAQPSLSRLRYWMASARCSTRMSSLSAISAMVRATLRIRS